MLNFTKTTRITAKLVLISTFAIMLCGCRVAKTEVKTKDETKIEQPVIKGEEFVAAFEKEEIPEDIKVEMLGTTIHEESLVTFDGLSYLTLTYVGYDGENHIGNMVIDKELADEVISIFKELYEIEFPIELMEPAYKFGGDDEASMESNNTSAFNDRPVTGGTELSYHQLGRAIDINPYVNPYVKASEGIVLPASAGAYTKRNIDALGMIKSNSDCVKIFKKYGWTWGGDWRSLKDYQHFEKAD